MSARAPSATTSISGACLQHETHRHRRRRHQHRRCPDRGRQGCRAPSRRRPARTSPTGILDALKSLARPALARAQEDRRRDDRHDALHQRRGAAPQPDARSRRCGSACRPAASLPPFCDWPEDLAALVRGGVWMVEGGHEYDGRPFMPLDEAAVRKAAEEMQAAGLRSVGISAIFSPLDPATSERAAEIVARGIPGRRDHLLARPRPHRPARARERRAAECRACRPRRATPIARLREGDRRFRHRRAALHHPERRHGRRGEPGAAPAGLQLRLGRHQLDARRRLPLRARRRHGDRCRRHHDRCRPAEARLSARGQLVVKVGGVRTLFRMPDLLSIGLGGGSHVAARSAEGRAASRRLSPDRGGASPSAASSSPRPISPSPRALLEHRRQDEGRAPRRRDLRSGVRRGRAHGRGGDRPDEDRGRRRAADRRRRRRLPDPGAAGRAFASDPREHGDCANAVGAAIAQVSGEVDQIFKDLHPRRGPAGGAGHRQRPGGRGRRRARLAQDHRSEDMPLAYLPGNSVRVRVRVVGDVAAG